MSDGPAEVPQDIDAGGAFARTLGIDLVSAGEGACVLRLTVTDAMLNGAGTCHGGVLFALADSATGAAGWSLGKRTVAQQASMDWLRPAHAGEVLTADCRLTASAGRSLVFDVTVTNQDGETIAVLRGLGRETRN